MTQKTKISGYTLLEVMAALIIIGISITAVTGALSTAKGLSARADNAVESVRILKNILNNPELMQQIMENKNFEKVLDNENGWICKSETTPLIIDSADLLWDNSSDPRFGVKKNRTRTAKQKKEAIGVKNRKNRSTNKNIVGEEIEVPGMVDIVLCVSQENQSVKKEYCITRWKRVDGSADSELITTPAKPSKNEKKTK